MGLQSKDMQIRLFGDPKLPIGVIVSVSLRLTVNLSREYAAFHPLSARVSSGPSRINWES